MAAVVGSIAFILVLENLRFLELQKQVTIRVVAADADGLVVLDVVGELVHENLAEDHDRLCAVDTGPEAPELSQIGQGENGVEAADENGVDVLDVDEIKLRGAELEERVDVDAVVEFECAVDWGACGQAEVGHGLETLVGHEELGREVLQGLHVERAVQHDCAAFDCEDKAGIGRVAVKAIELHFVVVCV